MNDINDLIRRLLNRHQAACAMAARKTGGAIDAQDCNQTLEGEAARALEAMKAEVEKAQEFHRAATEVYNSETARIRADSDRRVEEEREACAQLAERPATSSDSDVACETVAKRIRSRASSQPAVDALTAPATGRSPISQGSIAPSSLSEVGKLLTDLATYAPPPGGRDEAFATEPPEWAVAEEFGLYGDKCGRCDSWCEVVRHGKTQCPTCEDDSLTAFGLRALNVLTHLSAKSKCSDVDVMTAPATGRSPISQEQGSIAVTRLSDRTAPDAHPIRVYSDEDGSLGLTQANGTRREDYILLDRGQEAQLLQLLLSRAKEHGSIEAAHLSEEMDFGTLDKVRALSPEAAAVVKWGLRLEGALHQIEGHSEGYSADQMRQLARNAIRPSQEQGSIEAAPLSEGGPT